MLIHLDAMEEDKNILLDLNLTPIDQELELELQKKAEQEEETEQEVTFAINSRRDERYFAFYLLYALDRSDYVTPLEDVIKTFESGFELQNARQSFAIDLVEGVISHKQELDDKLKPHLKNWDLERLGCCTRLILWLALWEMHRPDAVKSIVINEAVELAKAFAEKDAYRFVNGILDEIAKAAGIETEYPEACNI